MPWPLEALCLYPLWHPMLCPWEISVLSCGHWRGRDKVEHSCFPACCQPRGAQSPGRAVSRCDPCPGTLPAVLPMEGTQPQPPAPLWHPGDCEGLFSYAGSGSDCRVLSNISSHLYSGMNPLWLFFSPSLLDGQHSEDARLSSSRACVAARGGSTAHSCCLPLGGIARVSSPCTFPVAAMLGLSRHRAWGTAGSSSSAVGQALPRDQGTTGLCFWFPKLLLFKSWAGER